MDKASLMLNLIAASSEGGIDEQNQNGQIVLARDFNKIPRKIQDGNTRRDLKKLGFVFGKDIDELFVEVTPPEGWTLRRTDHAMWSYVYDEQGRQRASVFYKAAFYDTDAFISLNLRYRIKPYQLCDVDGHRLPEEVKESDYMLCEVVDHDGSSLIVVGLRESKHYQRADELNKRAEKWLKENKPKWRDPLAYWEDN